MDIDMEFPEFNLKMRCCTFVLRQKCASPWFLWEITIKSVGIILNNFNQKQTFAPDSKQAPEHEAHKEANVSLCYRFDSRLPGLGHCLSSAGLQRAGVCGRRRDDVARCEPTSPKHHKPPPHLLLTDSSTSPRGSDVKGFDLKSRRPSARALDPELLRIKT